jgi:hypothetical protein
MFDDIDEALRQLLTRELPIKNNEIDVAFHQPKREWSARLSRPTLNFFLYDLRENAKMRSPTPAFDTTRNEDGTISQRRKPVRMYLYYMITAWANEPEDEHRLLARTMMVFYRWPELPADILPESLRDQPAPISIQVAQQDVLDKPSDIWSVLDNQMRPAIPCVVSMAMNPFKVFTVPPVRTVDMGLSQSERPATREITPGSRIGNTIVSGRVRSKMPLQKLRIAIVGRGRDALVVEGGEGEYIINNIEPGDYTLEVSAENRPASRHALKVPSQTYDIEV